MKGTYYINDNGRISSGSLDEKSINKVFNEFEIPSFSSALEDLFFGPGLAAKQLMQAAPRKMNKLSCACQFPPNSKWVDPETKVLHIDIAAVAVNEDEFRAEIDNDKIIVTFGRKAENEKLYDYKGLKLITDEVLEFNFDPRFHDQTSAKCELKNGLLSITLDPREEVKPTKKVLGGTFTKEEKKDEE